MICSLHTTPSPSPRTPIQRPPLEHAAASRYANTDTDERLFRAAIFHSTPAFAISRTSAPAARHNAAFLLSHANSPASPARRHYEALVNIAD
jgi:hypothetical protein